MDSCAPTYAAKVSGSAKMDVNGGVVDDEGRLDWCLLSYSS